MGENIFEFRDDPEVDEVEEALSLCDLPLDTDETNEKGFDRMSKSSHTRRSSSDPSDDLFEFFNDFSTEMCPADDIIFCGKLVPFKEQPALTIQQKPQKTSDLPRDDNKKQFGFRKRSESLSDLNSHVSRSDSTKKNRLLTSSRSINYQKLSRSKTCPDLDMERNSSGRSVGKSDGSTVKKPVKPRWYIFMFGMVKFPTEMELKDIKNRQFRRNLSAMFPPVDTGNKLPINRSSGKGSWSLLKALSCRDHTSVAVTTSFCMPHA